MAAGAARTGPGETPGDAGRYGAKRQGAGYSRPVVLLLGKRGVNSKKTPMQNLPRALQVQRCLWDEVPPLDFPGIRPRCWGWGRVLPFNLLRLLEMLFWGRLGMPRPGPSGSAGSGSAWKAKGAGGSGEIWGCHEGVGQGDVPRLFPAPEEKQHLAKGGFYSDAKPARQEKRLG